MRKSWNLTGKILSGKKKIESRWYAAKFKPWDAIRAGEDIFFQNSGEPVTVKAKVGKVVQFSGLTKDRVMGILKRYGNDIGIEEKDTAYYYKIFKDKKYCILVFLKQPALIKPFKINKNGFGIMSAWITVDSVGKLKKVI